MYLSFKLKHFFNFKTMLLIFLTIIALASILIIIEKQSAQANSSEIEEQTSEKNSDEFIKWVDFDVSYEALDKALRLDVESQNEEITLDWIKLLSCAAAKNGGNLKNFNTGELDKIAEQYKEGNGAEEIVGSGLKKYYDYYYEVYSAILGEFVGYYELGSPSEEVAGYDWELKYGLKVFSPIGEGFYYSHYDDFGNSRSYGYARRHLGNDIMGGTGTPIIAVEGGTIEAMGWNQYGGWRIGVRSTDSKRYYYYAHLQKDSPFKSGLKEGDTVQAGDVIGYMGRTGYSTTENVNNIGTTHLHFGMQLIFDESQKEGNGEIWIDVYNIVRLLDRHRCTVAKDPESGDYHRVYSVNE